MNKIIFLLTGLILSASVFYSCGSIKIKAASVYISKTPYKAYVSVHDPSIFKDFDGSYYIFGSHMDTAKSEDLMKWKKISSGVSKSNRLFNNLFTDFKAFDYVGKNNTGNYSVWAPDVIYNPVMKKYMMYFCTTSTYIKSNLCLALADSAAGPYSYISTFLYSGFTPRSIDKTNVMEILGKESPEKYFTVNRYNNMEWPNAIDPALFYDAEGKLWMSYGSWSGGIFILEINQNTGLPIHPESDEANGVDRYFGKHLAGGLHNSIEGPYIIYDRLSRYYYLFVSYGALTSNGGYQIRLFRSQNPDGPYTDPKGQELGSVTLHRDFGLKLMGNYSFPSLLQAYKSPGHNSAFISENNEIFLVYHVRFENSGENHEPRVHRLFRTSNGWLTAAPFAYTPEDSLIFINDKNINGHYFMLNHGLDIDSSINRPIEIYLHENGKIYTMQSKFIGKWTKTGDSKLEIILNDEIYHGVFISQKDEAKNQVFAFSAISKTNQSIWGVQYQ